MKGVLKNASLLPLLSFLLVISLGCRENREVNLRERAETYNRLYRWKKVEEASIFVKPDKREKYLEEVEPLMDHLNITDYQVGKVILFDRGSRARVQIKRTFFQLPSVIERKETQEQEWLFYQGQWYLESNF
jgi:ABC-type Na+ transport system ATPase subunit NatA